MSAINASACGFPCNSEGIPSGTFSILPPEQALNKSVMPRVDRTRLAFEHELTLGHFGLPHIDGKKAVVNQFEDENKKVITAAIEGRRVALIAYNGWDKLDTLVHTNMNAEADESTVVYAYKKRLAKNPAMEITITVLLHKTDGSEWTEEELSPIKNIEIMDVTPVWSALGARLTLSNDKVYEVYFDKIDGNRRS